MVLGCGFSSRRQLFGRSIINVTDRVSRYVRELEAGPSGRLAAALASATAGQRRAIAAGLEALRELLEGGRGTAGTQRASGPRLGASSRRIKRNQRIDF